MIPITFLIPVALILGIIIGCLITKTVTQRQLYMAYSRGIKKTSKKDTRLIEHLNRCIAMDALLIEHLNRRIARIEMQNRRYGGLTSSIDGGIS